ncbi:4Fe-4S dicluster domain-containing protein [Methanosarcina barkeri]|nr:4Fe-4S binding protein [Methanosarcina barkeri]
MKLSKNANDCIECGVCEKNCPFHVNIRGRMLEAKHYFDKLR